MKDLWNHVRHFKTKPSVNPIEHSQLYDHFSDLLNKSKQDIDNHFSEYVTEILRNHNFSVCKLCQKSPFNETIKQTEIENAINSISSGKAPGPDGLVGEVYKCLKNDIVPYLKSLYNIILSTGEFPDNWSKAILTPIHKKGNRQDPTNYRGIALTDVIGKIFTKILNERLVSWAEKNGKFKEAQCGYRHKRSTVDHIFSLMGAIQKYISKKKGRLYCLYIDFSAAFDSVRHDMLWYVLMKQDIHGNLLKTLQSMYKKLQSSVQVTNGITQYFKCENGTRQGCMISSSLFVLFLNELYEMFEQECQGRYISEMVPNLTSLFYADDIANISDSIGRLQKQLNILARYCSLFGMKVNIDKTKIIVFRRGGIVKQNEKWLLNDKPIEVVSHYKYLGITFTSFLSWSHTQKTQAAQAEKTIALLKRMFKAADLNNVQQMLTLFDRMVSPILCYGSEIWGTKKIEIVERVQTKFCKFLLGVNYKTSNAAALGECGRLPMAVVYIPKCINYWIKLTQMTDVRYPKNIYTMLYRLDEAGRYTWASEVKSILLSFGFGYIWFSQTVGNSLMFMSEFKQRIKDCFMQNWERDIGINHKLQYYKDFKTGLFLENYILCITDFKFRKALAKLRCSAHNLNNEIGRYKNDEFGKLCNFCLTTQKYIEEDEFHFVMQCPNYSELRAKYISTECTNIYNFVNLMTSKDITVLLNLAKFVFYAYQKRNNQF